MSRFEPRFVQAISNYVTHLLNNFEMNEWEVVLKDDPPEGRDCGASISTIYGRKHATIRLAMDFFEYSRKDQSHYIIHEICHLFSEGLDNVVMNGPEILMGKPAFTIMEENYKVQMEYMTDKLATVLRFYTTGGEEHDKLFNELMASEQPLPVTKEEE